MRGSELKHVNLVFVKVVSHISQIDFIITFGVVDNRRVIFGQQLRTHLFGPQSLYKENKQNYDLPIHFSIQNNTHIIYISYLFSIPSKIHSVTETHTYIVTIGKIRWPLFKRKLKHWIQLTEANFNVPEWRISINDKCQCSLLI